MITYEIVLVDWSVTIENDYAYLFGTRERLNDVQKQEITAIEFSDVAVYYEEESKTVDAIAPGFKFTVTDGTIYWCNIQNANSYTLEDTKTSLSRVVAEDVVDMINDYDTVYKRIEDVIEEYKMIHGIEDEEEVDFFV